MADSTTSIDLIRNDLVNLAAAGFGADITPGSIPAWGTLQPVAVYRTAQTTARAVPTFASGDYWRLTVRIPTAAEDNVFYPICLRLSLFNDGADAAFDTLWTSALTWSIQPSVNSHERSVGGPGSYRTGTLSDVVTSNSFYEGDFKIQDFAPSFHGFPVQPFSPIVDNAYMSVITVQVATWDAAAAANTSAYLDVRFLAYPKPISRTGDFYVPTRLGFAN